MNNFVQVTILAASFIAAVGAIITAMKKILNKIMSPITHSLEKMDERQCRAWLVDFLNDVENGEAKDEVQFEFAHEVYDHYTKDLHKNSYIHDKWERVMNKK